MNQPGSEKDPSTIYPAPTSKGRPGIIASSSSRTTSNNSNSISNKVPTNSDILNTQNIHFQRVTNLNLGLCHRRVFRYKLYILVCEDLAGVSTAHCCVLRCFCCCKTVEWRVRQLSWHVCSGLGPGWDWDWQPASQSTAPQLTTTTPGPAGSVVGLVLCKKYESIMVIDLAKGSEVLLVLRLLNKYNSIIGQFYRLSQ